MKKILSTLLFMLVPVLASADGIGEEELAGKWVLESYEGEFVYSSSETIYHYDESTGEEIFKKIKCYLARPDIIEFYNEEQHQTENRESLGVAKFQSEEEYTCSFGIGDYMLYDSSSGRLRLHISYRSGHSIVRYIVNSITFDRMELMTYDKKGKVVYVRDGNPNAATENKSRQGDLNNDGVIDAADVVKLTDIIMNK